MSARVHVILGGAGAGKTTHLLHRYHEVARGQPRSALWLGPTRRGIEEVRGRLAAQSGALLGCLLYTFQEFVEEIVRVHEPATRPLSHVQRRLLLEEVISDLVHREDLQPFAPVLETRGFIEGLLTLLVGLKRVEITPLTFARAAYRRGAGTVHPARQIAEWGITPKDRACARIFARYEQALRQQGLLDVEGQVVRAASLLRQGAHGPGGPLARVQAVFLDGFITFTPSQQEILEALRSRVSEMWIALPDEPGNERSELFARPRATFAFLQRESAEEEGAQGHVCCHRLGERVPPAPLPEGLVHLEKQLFRPLRRVEVGTNAEGICCLEAPGVLGEARMVARRIKELLLEGVTPEEIVVTMREVGPYVDRLQEVFEEYGISVDIEGHESLLHAPPVALLLRALRLPEDDWPFAGVTALLRNNYCMPRWPENAADPEMLDKTEALLRLLGEPRGREAYLAAARRWAERQQEGLEDEDAEEARRRRTHELAKHCLAFLERFLQSWDRMPVRAPVANHRDWLVAFAREMGIDEMARVDPRDALALDTLWQELDRWCRRDQESIRAGSVSDGSSGSVSDGPSLLDRHTFFHRLTALAGEAGIPRTLATGGKARSAHVRVLSAELSRHLSVP
jgi:ATP-dependent helicase/DNAse subunit B